MSTHTDTTSANVQSTRTKYRLLAATAAAEFDLDLDAPIDYYPHPKTLRELLENQMHLDCIGHVIKTAHETAITSDVIATLRDILTDDLGDDAPTDTE